MQPSRAHQIVHRCGKDPKSLPSASSNFEKVPPKVHFCRPPLSQPCTPKRDPHITPSPPLPWTLNPDTAFGVATPDDVQQRHAQQKIHRWTRRIRPMVVLVSPNLLQRQLETSRILQQQSCKDWPVHDEVDLSGPSSTSARLTPTKNSATPAYGIACIVCFPTSRRSILSVQ